MLSLSLYPRDHHPGIEEENNTELLQAETNSFLPQYTSLPLKVCCSKEIHLQFFFYITVAMPSRAPGCFHILFSSCSCNEKPVYGELVLCRVSLSKPYRSKACVCHLWRDSQIIIWRFLLFFSTRAINLSAGAFCCISLAVSTEMKAKSEWGWIWLVIATVWSPCPQCPPWGVMGSTCTLCTAGLHSWGAFLGCLSVLAQFLWLLHLRALLSSPVCVQRLDFCIQQQSYFMSCA